MHEGSAPDRGQRQLAPGLAAHRHPDDPLRRGLAARRGQLQRAGSESVDQRRQHPGQLQRRYIGVVQLEHQCRQPLRHGLERVQVAGPGDHPAGPEP